MHAHTLLKDQHREVENLYNSFIAASPENRKEFGDSILSNLTVHAEIEEEIYYPLLENTSASALRDEFKAEHDAMKLLMLKLGTMDGDTDEYAPTMKALMDIVKHHVEEEEQKGMPRIESLVSENKLNEIGKEMNERAEELKKSSLKRFVAAIT